MKGYLENYINDELKINCNMLIGTIELDMLLEYLKNLVETNEYKDQYNVLVDIREAKMPDFLARMDEFINFFKSTSGAINWNRKCAILTSKTDDVVISELLRYRMENLHFHLRVQVFSTREAAFFWLI